MRTGIIACIVCIAATLASGQSQIYTSNQSRHISIVDLQSGNCMPAIQVISDVSLSDIALHPNGKMYGVSFSQRRVYEVNMTTGATTPILQIAEADKLVGMTADANGLLYVTEGNVIPSDLYVVDPAAGTYVNKGPLADGSAGDLTWSFGKLYNASDNNKLVEVNIEDPASSIVIGNFNGIVKAGDRMFALVTVFTSCTETVTYGLSVFGDYYTIDLATANVSRICIGNVDLYGATSADEFLASECFVGIDLDEDNSTGNTSIDFQTYFNCETSSAPVADSDAVLVAASDVDSLILRLLLPVPDGAAEAFQTGAAPNLVVSNTGQVVRAINDGGASIDDFLTFLHGVRYTNAAFPVTESILRFVEVVAYSEGFSDTALASIDISPLYPGPDGAVGVCPGDTAYPLLSALLDGIREDGTWIPALASGTDVYNATIDPPGTYQYAITDGCAVDTVLVAVSLLSDAAVLLRDTVVCNGGNVVLDADIGEPAAGYLWSTGATSASITASVSGTYSVAVNWNGCIISDTAEVTFVNAAVDLGPDFSLCPGDDALLDADVGNPDAAYTWNTGATSSGLLVNSGGNYSVVVDIMGCTFTDAVTVSAASGGTVDFDLGGDVTICFGESAALSSGFSTSVYNHTWNTGSTNASINTSTPGTYILTLSNSCQSGTDSVSVFAIDCDSIPDPVDTTIVEPEPPCELLLPSAFTPNSDRINDFFGPLNPCPEITGYTFRVYNRYGELVFASVDSSWWDGTFRGQPVPLEVYVWYVEWTAADGRTVRRTGAVSVLR